MFNDDFSYNHRPADHVACCLDMQRALEKDGSVEVLGNYRHIIDWKSGCGCTVLKYCPWCLTPLPH